MPEFQLEKSVRRHPSEAHLQSVPAESRLESDMRSVIEAYREELDEYYGMARRWADSEPDVVLMQLSAITARLTEIRAHLYRDNGQRASRLRISEIDPLIEECDRQFKFHSRLQAIRELDFRMAGGAPS